MSNTINPLKVSTGQWIQFVTEESSEELTPGDKVACSFNRPFLVITCDKACHCILVDLEGGTHAYSGKSFALDSNRLLHSEIEVFSEKQVEKSYGADKVEALYQKLRDRLNLSIGEWVYFSVEGDPKSLAAGDQVVYDYAAPLRVVAQEVGENKRANYQLLDLRGNAHVYSGAAFTFDSKRLSSVRVKHLSDKLVRALYARKKAANSSRLQVEKG